MITLDSKEAQGSTNADDKSTQNRHFSLGELGVIQGLTPVVVREFIGLLTGHYVQNEPSFSRRENWDKFTLAEEYRALLPNQQFPPFPENIGIDSADVARQAAQWLNHPLLMLKEIDSWRIGLMKHTCIIDWVDRNGVQTARAFPRKPKNTDERMQRVQLESWARSLVRIGRCMRLSDSTMPMLNEFDFSVAWGQLLESPPKDPTESQIAIFNDNVPANKDKRQLEDWVNFRNLMLQNSEKSAKGSNTEDNPLPEGDSKAAGEASGEWIPYSYEDRLLTAKTACECFRLSEPSLTRWATVQCRHLGRKLNRKRHPDAGSFVYLLTDIRSIVHARTEEQ